jgi:uncharacterized protein VirK/YbjX
LLLYPVPSLLIAGASSVVGGALLLAGEPLTAAIWSAALIATARWTHAPAPVRRRSFWGDAAVSHPAGTPSWRRKRAKFLLRTAVQRRTSRAWLDRLNRPDLRPLWALHPRLGAKSQRPYLRRDWGARTPASPRWSRTMTPWANCFRRAPAGGSMATARRCCGWPAARRDAPSTSGWFIATAGRRAIWIGGLQASRDPRMRALIQEVTKELHGLRPKALALWCLRQMCAPWGAVRIRAAGDREHTCPRRHRGKFMAAYDEFWAESGGVRRLDGGWDLPLEPAVRPREEIKPSRRKAHELRYAMLDALRADFAASLAALEPSGA